MDYGKFCTAVNSLATSRWRDMPRSVAGSTLRLRHTAHPKRRIRPRDGSSVDWSYETEKERYRVSRLAEKRGLSGTLARLTDAIKPWIVTMTTGLCVGLLATYLDVVSALLSDLRMGICTSQPYLTRNACCTGLDPSDTCHEWIAYAHMSGALGSLLAFIIYLGTAVVLATIAAYFVRVYAPYAFHTGIPEIKAILGGLVIDGYLGAWTLLIKAVSLSLAVASGLSLGNEGPMVHIACCVGNIIADLFSVFRNNERRKRDMLSAAAAAGLSVAFGAPLGGVLFSLEEASSFFPGSVLWHSFVCAIVAAVTLQYFDPYGTGRLVLFEVNTDTEWRGFEILPWLFLGACGGLFGHYFTRANSDYAQFRSNSALSAFPVLEVTGLAAITAVASYLIPLTRIPTAELVSALFTDCTGSAVDPLGLCERGHPFTVASILVITAIAKIAFTVATFGARVPAGIFLPATAIGACFGRAVGTIMQEWQRAFPSFWLFSSCPPDAQCIAPALYAVVGAASALGGVTRMTLSLVVVVFELTGVVSLVVQIMLAIMISKFVGDFLDRDGIYETWIGMRNYAFVDPKVDFRRDDLVASKCMTPYEEMINLYESALTCTDVEILLNEHLFRGFAIVASAENPTLIGYIARPELEHALIEAAKSSEANHASRICFSATGSCGSPFVSVAPYVEHTPLTVSANMPMEVVVQLFQRLGLRYALLTSKGRLAGLLTKSDIQHLIRTDGSRSASADLVSGVRERRRRSSSASLSQHIVDTEVPNQSYTIIGETVP